MKVLVDTPVWIDHLHREDPMLRRLLRAGVVNTALPVLGELAAGTIPNRRRILSDLRLMPRLVEPAGDEVLDWIETHSLWGKGLSWVDCLLLATSERGRAQIYTSDRVLARYSRMFNLAFRA